MGRDLAEAKYYAVLKFLDRVAGSYVDKLRGARRAWEKGNAKWLDFDRPETEEARKAFYEETHAAIWHAHNVVAQHFSKKLGVEDLRATRNSAAESRQWLRDKGKLRILSAMASSIERISRQSFAHELLNAD